MVMEGGFPSGGERTVQPVDDVLYKYTLEPYKNLTNQCYPNTFNLKIFKIRLRRVPQTVAPLLTLREDFLLWFDRVCLPACLFHCFPCTSVDECKRYCLDATSGSPAFLFWSEILHRILLNLNLLSVDPLFLDKSKYGNILFLFGHSLITLGTYEMSDLVSLQKLCFISIKV